jgi:uncharacterized DUF497 family protein
MGSFDPSSEGLIARINGGTLIGVAITWTEAKRLKVLQERRLDLARAEEVFAGLTATNRTHGGPTGEIRYITAGFLDGRMVVTVWTPRGRGRHIISMRHAHAKEQRYWNEEMGRSG